MGYIKIWYYYNAKAKKKFRHFKMNLIWKVGCHSRNIEALKLMTV